MDSRFFVTEETYRVNLEHDQWVDVKKEMSIADWDKFEAEMVTLTPDSETPHGTFHRSELTLLEINIMAWSFDAPITRDNIGKLRRPHADIITTTIDALNVSPKERAAVMPNRRTRRSTQRREGTTTA